MANADCLVCFVTNYKLANALGTPGNPIGACNACHSFACGEHGQRDPNGPQFICVLCDPAHAAASAAALIAPATTNSLARLQTFLPEQFIPFKSVEDFARRRPAYGKEFLAGAEEYSQDGFRLRAEAVPRIQADSDLDWTVSALIKNKESSALLALAVFLTRRLDLFDRVPDMLRKITQSAA